MEKQTSPSLEALHVGKIYVVVKNDYSFGVWQARTDPTILGALPFEVVVEAIDIDDERPDVELVREVLDGMRRALARCFIWGVMVPYVDAPDSDADSKILDEVIAGLSEDYFRITPALSAEAVKGLAEAREAVASGFETPIKAMKEEGLRRGLNKEEREKMTIGEFIESAEEE